MIKLGLILILVLVPVHLIKFSWTELRWFTNYLSHRMQHVKCGGDVSEWGSVMGGIPQGSALGPLLFLVYVNDMH